MIIETTFEPGFSDSYKRTVLFSNFSHMELRESLQIWTRQMGSCNVGGPIKQVSH